MLRDRFRSRLEQRWADRIEEIASEEIALGATATDIRSRVIKRLEAESTSRPFVDFLMKLFEQLLPFLLQLLGGFIGGMTFERGELDMTTFETVGPDHAKRCNALANLVESANFADKDDDGKAQAFALALPSAALNSLNALASFFSVDTLKLLTCIAGQIGWAKLIDCLRNSPSDWLKCVGGSINILGVVACLGIKQDSF